MLPALMNITWNTEVKFYDILAGSGNTPIHNMWKYPSNRSSNYPTQDPLAYWQPSFSDAENEIFILSPYLDDDRNPETFRNYSDDQLSAFNDFGPNSTYSLMDVMNNAATACLKYRTFGNYEWYCPTSGEILSVYMKGCNQESIDKIKQITKFSNISVITE